VPFTTQIKTRLVFLLLLGAVCVLLGGCVYLRLLELKKQLNHFDANFVIPPTEDLTIKCLHPLLQAEDLRWLGASPKTIVPLNGGEDWIIRWVKESAPGVKEELIYDMELDVSLVDGRMVEVRVPKRFLVYISKDLFVNMLRSTGTAKVDRDDRQADAQTETPDATTLPNLRTIKSMLGEPTSMQSTPDRIIHFYRYRLDIANTAAKPIEALFTFDSATGELRKFTARLPRGTLNYDFKSRPATKPREELPATSQAGTDIVR